jgi:CheY-like chemotaxis protein
MKFTNSGHIQCGYKLKDDKLVFYVEDTGVGISKEIKDVIFERFRQGATSLTRAYEGSGLGLSISKGIIELLGGEIWFESKEKQGTTFYFSHPVSREKVSEDDGEREKIAGKSQNKDWKFDGKKVLLVEDDISSQMLLSQYLKDMNVNVTTVDDGEKAIIRCKLEKIDLVLMDIKLPSMDGYQAYEKIREVKPKLPVIAQTAYAMSGDRAKALRFGFDDYVSKPVARETLAEILSRFLN